MEWAVKRLRNNRAGGPSRIRAEDLKGWLAAKREDTKEAGAAVEALMRAYPPLNQEAWHRLQGWYKATADRPPPPA